MTATEHLQTLQADNKVITLIGTAHVSKQSADLVDHVIRELKPETVCVELCQSRYQSIAEKKQWQEMNLYRVVKEKKSFLLLSNFVLAYVQKKIGQKLGVKPGEEIVRAIEAAKSVDAHIHLVDRDVRVTLLRAWRLMGTWSKIKLLYELVSSLKEMDEIDEDVVEKMKTKDVLSELLAEMGESFPEITQVLIDERDRYLAEMIRTAPGDRIVAVVGAGHMPGIKRYWGQSIDIASLNEIPPAGKIAKILKWTIPTLILSLIVFGFFRAGKSVGTDMLKYWIVANGSLAGLGAALALAHPLTIVSAVLASPFTSLNPMIAAGWISGLVEAFLGKPKVKDFESLSEDLASVRGFWKNKITRILLVVVFTNIGSSLGTFVAVPLMLRLMS